MKNQSNENIIYSLNIEDIQNVALQELGRELTQSETESIIEEIEKNINWYDAISYAISSKIK